MVTNGRPADSQTSGRTDGRAEGRLEVQMGGLLDVGTVGRSDVLLNGGMVGCTGRQLDGWLDDRMVVGQPDTWSMVGQTDGQTVGPRICNHSACASFGPGLRVICNAAAPPFQSGSRQVNCCHDKGTITFACPLLRYIP